MTRLLLDAAVFALGLYLSLRAIAACYRVLDLWYAIRTAYPSVLRGLVVWVGSTVLLILRLEGSHGTAFVAGLLTFLAFQLSLYRLRYLMLRRVPESAAE